MKLQQFLHNFLCSIGKTKAKQRQADSIVQLEAERDRVNTWIFIIYPPLLFQFDFGRSIRVDSKFFPLMQMELEKEALSKSVFCRLNKVESENLKAQKTHHQSFWEHIALKMLGRQVLLKDPEASECRASMTKYESKFLNQLGNHFGTTLCLHNIDHHSKCTQKDNHPKIMILRANKKLVCKPTVASVLSLAIRYPWLLVTSRYGNKTRISFWISTLLMARRSVIEVFPIDTSGRETFKRMIQVLILSKKGYQSSKINSAFLWAYY